MQLPRNEYQHIGIEEMKEKNLPNHDQLEISQIKYEITCQHFNSVVVSQFEDERKKKTTKEHKKKVMRETNTDMTMFEHVRNACIVSKYIRGMMKIYLF